ncbi:MAG: thioredoxin fold domain-containing protein [Candidatus Hydrogenedens sp.]|nr:thioredoxin fold domain-containing protein [Candidatus Hydrogenedens sp.]
MKAFSLFVIAGLTVNCCALGQMSLGMAGPEVSFETAVQAVTVVPGSRFAGAVRVSLSDGWHVNAHEPLDDFLIATVLSFEEKEGFSLQATAYPEAKVITLSFSPDPLAVYEEIFMLAFEMEVDSEVAAGDYALEGVLQFQACNDAMCAAPRTESFSLSVTVGEASTEEEENLPAWFEDAPFALLKEAEDADEEAAPAVEDPEEDAETVADAKESTDDVSAPGNWKELADQFQVVNTLAGYSDKDGFLAFIAGDSGGDDGSSSGGRSGLWLLWIVIGGFLLNFTPCVLPLIPINIAIIGAGAKAGSRSRGFALGGAYGLGIALVYGSLGLLVVLGLSSAFGTLNSTVWFNGAIALLFVVLGLAMFDIVQIDFSRFQTRLGLTPKEGGHFFAALGMGAVSALLAGACVAPVVIYTVLQAQDLYSQGNMLALALPFGLGVGMALPWPFLGAGLSLLPKPGMWMVRVKQAFGVFILAFAVYYGYLAWSLMAPASTQVDDEGLWVHQLEAGLEQALENRQPVLIDFWATWCKNCSVMNRTVLQDPEVLEALDSHVKIKYQAESLQSDPTRDVVEYYKVLGLPTFILLEPKE